MIFRLAEMSSVKSLARPVKENMFMSVFLEVASGVCQETATVRERVRAMVSSFLCCGSGSVD